MDSDGIRRLIVIPQTQYQQLIRNQKATTTTTTPPKNKDDENVDKGEQNQCQNEDSRLPNEGQMGVIYGGDDDHYNVDDVEGKILQIIQCSYPKPIMKKMRKLFLFIIHFGSDVLNLNQRGNVLIRGQIIDPKSNILDLLESSVSDQFSGSPAGYRAFLQVLREINVPSNFYISDRGPGKWCKEKREVGRWRPY